MRLRILRATLALATIGLFACEDESGPCGNVSFKSFSQGTRTDRGPEGLSALRREVKIGVDKFELLRKQHHDNYVYVAQLSSFTGSTCTTTVTVRSGVVVRREQLQSTAPREERVPDNWVEEAPAIGSHQGCHPVMTLPELFAACLDRTMCEDPRENYLYFDKDDQGVPIACLSAPLNCADDCSEGLSLRSVTWE